MRSCRNLRDCPVLRILLLMLLAAPSHLLAQRVALYAEDGNQRVELDRLAQVLKWQPAHPGLAISELQLRAGSMRWPVRTIAVRIEPDSFDLELVMATASNRMTGIWNVDSTAATAALAFNAGQFKETGPWGWLVMNSYERRDPGFGPLSAGIAIDTAGRVRWIAPAQLANARTDRSIRFAFQSYPLLLMDGVVPPLLYVSDDVDRDHRDARLILAQMPDSSLLILLTRFDGFGGNIERVPIGLTVPESVALVGALGARNAVMLDGGISAQMLVRQANGIVHKWSGFRNVPLALVAHPRKR